MDGTSQRSGEALRLTDEPDLRTNGASSRANATAYRDGKTTRRAAALSSGRIGQPAEPMKRPARPRTSRSGGMSPSAGGMKQASALMSRWDGSTGGRARSSAPGLPCRQGRGTPARRPSRGRSDSPAPPPASRRKQQLLRLNGDEGFAVNLPSLYAVESASSRKEKVLTLKLVHPLLAATLGILMAFPVTPAIWRDLCHGERDP